MKKVYLYIHHSGFDFFLSDHKLTHEEAYCPDCDESNELVGVYDNAEALAAKIQELQKSGLDLITE